MMLFMTQATYTAQAWASLIKEPQDRRAAISDLIEKAGGELHDLWFSFGETDIVFIFEAEDALVAAAVSVAGNAAGHIKSIRTTQLMSVTESLELMRLAQELGPAPAPAASTA